MKSFSTGGRVPVAHHPPFLTDRLFFGSVFGLFFRLGALHESDELDITRRML